MLNEKKTLLYNSKVHTMRIVMKKLDNNHWMDLNMFYMPNFNQTLVNSRYLYIYLYVYANHFQSQCKRNPWAPTNQKRAFLFL